MGAMLSTPEEVQWEIEDMMAEKNVNYVVFAYFDVGVTGVDATTGNQMVNVALTIAEITRLGDGDPVSLGTCLCDDKAYLVSPL